MAAPKVYKSTDANAPVLNVLSGSAVDLIRAICVTGYGDKPPLGWVEVFSKPGVIVIRQAESAVGNRLFYRIDDTVSATWAGRRKFAIDMYESMSDVDTGIGRTGRLYVYKTSVDNTSAREWIIIGDSAGFYMQTKSNPDYQTYGVYELTYTGSGVPLFSSDAWLSIISGIPDDDLYASTLPYLHGPNETTSFRKESLQIARNMAGTISPIRERLRLNGGFHLQKNMGNLGPLYPVEGQLLYTQPMLGDGIANTMRGYLPGLFCPEHSSGLSDGDIITTDGKSLMVLKGGANIGYGFEPWTMLIDIGEGFRL